MEKITNKYDSFNHSKCHIRYHLIFSTKYRRKCLTGIEDSVKETMYGIAKRCKFHIVEIGIDQDHIHMLVRARPSVSITQIVRRLKQVSTRELFAKEYEHLSKFYWGNKKHIWTNGYFCSTVGEINELSVLEYIKNQG